MNTEKKLRRLPMPLDARRMGKALLTQQCWCWGQDIKRPEGNALLQFGFELRRPPTGEPGATAYLLEHGEIRVALWGFGLFWGQAGSGGLFVGRFDFEPLWCDNHTPPHAWTPMMLHSLNVLRVPQDANERRQSRRLLSDCLDWAASYEEWALQAFGDDYRCRCLETWQQRAVVSRQDVPARWRELSGTLRPASC